jgi:hypothetical protein
MHRSETSMSTHASQFEWILKPTSLSW